MLETPGRGLFPSETSESEKILLDSLQPFDRFLIALKAPETKRQYPKRLETFLDFLKLRGNLKEKIMLFYQITKYEKDNDWLTDQLLKFLRYQKERVSKSEIQAATVSNYFKAIKLFLRNEQYNICKLEANL